MSSSLKQCELGVYGTELVYASRDIVALDLVPVCSTNFAHTVILTRAWHPAAVEEIRMRCEPITTRTYRTHVNSTGVTETKTSPVA